MDFITEYHSVGSVDLLDFVLAKIKRLAFITCCNGIYKVALVIADCAVGSDNIFCGTDFIGSAFQSCGFINRLVNGGDGFFTLVKTMLPSSVEFSSVMSKVMGVLSST